MTDLDADRGGVAVLVVITVPGPDSELACDLLWQLGVVAIEERALDDSGLVEVRTSLGDDPVAALEAIATFPVAWRRHTERIDPTVADTWRAHARPVEIDPGCRVVPAWIADEENSDEQFPDEERSAGTLVIRIEPGATFGLGDHPTTRLSLAAVRRLVATRVAERRAPTVLDVGCGSGVLAIGAVLTGATSALGIDIAAASPAIAVANAVANGVDGRARFGNEPLADVAGTFDVVVANILAPALIDLADDLRRVCADDGRLVISGLLADRYDHVVDALDPFAVERIDELDGWVAITLSRTPVTAG
jgi:ribosomal protein L11 methyltransferase